MGKEKRDHCSLSRENFERGGARENQREETLVKFSKTRKKRKGTNFEASIPVEWHKSRGSRTTFYTTGHTTLYAGSTVRTSQILR